MKFGKSWKSARECLPDRLQSHVINYKTYKKETKRKSIPLILEQLKQDVKRINQFWKYGSRTFSNDTLLSFIKLNKTSLYKVCKRADKRFQTSSFIEWHGHYKASMLAGVFGNFVQKRIEYKDPHMCLDICPICLDEDCKESILMCCGHMVCVPCLKEMLGVQKCIGTLTNVIAYGRSLNRAHGNCQVCRSDYALNRIYPIYR